MNNIFICTLQYTLAYKLTNGRCDMHICLYIVSLFAEMVLHVGQVPMYSDKAVRSRFSNRTGRSRYSNHSSLIGNNAMCEGKVTKS